MRRLYRWHWGSTDEDSVFDPKNDWAEWSNSERKTTLHPVLRQRKNHDQLWRTLGHEIVHAIHQDKGGTVFNEARARRMEQRAGDVLHDFYHRFKKSGLPRCTGDCCHVNESKRNR